MFEWLLSLISHAAIARQVASITKNGLTSTIPKQLASCYATPLHTQWAKHAKQCKTNILKRMENIHSHAALHHENFVRYLAIASTGLHLTIMTWIWCSERVAASCPVQVIALFHTGRWNCDSHDTRNFPQLSLRHLYKSLQNGKQSQVGRVMICPLVAKKIFCIWFCLSPCHTEVESALEKLPLWRPIYACKSNINPWKNSRERALHEQHPWVLELSRCSPWMPSMSR